MSCLRKKLVHKWTLSRFIRIAVSRYGGRYDYSQITEEHIKGNRSHIPIRCTICNYQSTPTIIDHIKYGSQCPNCVKRTPYTLELFLKRAIEIHGDNYDYSQIKEEDVKDGTSHVTVKCNTCDNLWKPTIYNHIRNKSGCRQCSKRTLYKLEDFICKAKQVYGNKYDYSLIKEEYFDGKYKVPVKCHICDNIWTVIAYRHIAKNSGCPFCAIYL